MELDVVVMDGRGALHPVRLAWGPGHRVRDLADAVQEHLGVAVGELHVRRGGHDRALDPDELVDLAALARGDALHAGRPRSSPTHVLAVCGGPDSGRLLSLGAAPVVVGRADDADLRLRDPVVSRRHCRVHVADGGLVVEDLGSANGTRVHGAPTSGPVLAGHGAVELGATAIRLLDPVAADDAVGAGVVVHVPRRDRAPAVPWRPADVAVSAGTDAVRADLRRRLHDHQPDLARCHLAARTRDHLLWSRDEVDVRIGRGPGVVVGEGMEVVVGDAPITVDPATGGIAVTGDPATCRGVAAGIVLRLATLVHPSELNLVVLASEAAPWRWVPWLPNGRLHVGAGAAAAALHDLSVGGGRSLVVVDHPLLGPIGDRLPDDHVVVTGAWGRARTTIDVAPDGTFRVSGSVHASGPGIDAVAPDTADVVARSLAPLVVRAPASASASGPTITDVVPAVDADGIAATWDTARPRQLPLGTSEAGVVIVPIDRHLHLDGASDDLVTAAVTSLAATVAPDRLAIVPVASVDARLGGLPHVLAPPVGTDPMGELVAERRRRDHLLQARGADDWAALRKLDPDATPVLLVLTAGPVTELGDAAALPGLGIHLLSSGEAPSATAHVVRVDGDRVEVVGDRGTVSAAALTCRASAPLDSVSVTAIGEDGRPITASRTSLSRVPRPVDTAAEVAACCRAAADGRRRPTWTAAVPTDQLPRVRRTFVFTDIEGSTTLVEAIGDRAWASLVQWHDALLREEFARHEGEEVDHAGDGFLVAFTDAAKAVGCAAAIQRRLDEHRRTAGFAPRVRIGGHVADVLGGDVYRGHGIHVAARVGALADGDQVVFSADVLDEAGPGPRVVASRIVEVKGASTPIEVCVLDWR